MRLKVIKEIYLLNTLTKFNNIKKKYATRFKSYIIN